ncbi:aquaporin-9-like [Tubulanus polymorphus]|uniref:aquaporin-9-like n=1 Tax=Tubulanus polymorphus TaxID=672921 RepID=UPI003DA38D8F
MEDLVSDGSKRKKSFKEKVVSKLRISNVYVREFLAELLGTFTLMLLGNSGVAQMVLGKNRHIGNINTVQWGYGIGVAMGVYMCAGVSGGHINPAVTIMFAVLGRFPWKKVLVYICAQLIGSFLSCPVIYINIVDDLNALDNGTRYVTGPLATAGIFATYPGPDASIGTCVWDTVVSSAVLAYVILGLIDQRNEFAPSKSLFPFVLGFSIIALLSGFVGNAGAILNPARDLPPRLFTLMAGWGVETFSIRNYGYFWIGIVAPIIGCIIGGLLYELLVELHWPQKNYEKSDGNVESDGLLLKALAHNADDADDDNFEESCEQC